MFNSIIHPMELTKNISQTRIIKSLFAIILGSLALTISAKIKIPFYPVPMTMQTFVVLFLGISLGYKIGLASVGLYLIEGIAGLPVFSNSPEKGVGLIYFTGPTMGYLIGFLAASYLASKISSKDNFLLVLAKLTIATSTIYLLGLLWLGTLIGWDKPIFALGAKPFLLAEVFKVVLLALLTKKILKIRNFI
ncbi:biotin transporter BioY [Candidatus Pelagibacter sp.]|nr:biotin transporter BioY [Candidatus Pelagibacter sp.]MDA7574830.1 biotin transporter BioY [Candidatus Pelagibacter sp.]MDB3942057.1 biotin transporter BioY [Candidatus Pelagibacter sp.]